MKARAHLIGVLCLIGKRTGAERLPSQGGLKILADGRRARASKGTEKELAECRADCGEGIGAA